MGSALEALTLGTATPQKARPRVPSNLERARAEGIPIPSPRDVDVGTEEPQFAFSSRIDSAFRVGKNQFFSIMDQPSATRELLRPTIEGSILPLRIFNQAVSSTAQFGEEALKLIFASPMAVFASSGELINQFVEKKAPAKPGVKVPRGGAGEEIFETLRDAFIQIGLATAASPATVTGGTFGIQRAARRRAKVRADKKVDEARAATAEAVAKATTEDAASAALVKGRVEKKIIDLESETMEFFGGKVSTQEIVESTELFQTRLNSEVLSKILETSKTAIRQLGSDPTGLRPQRVFEIVKGLLRSGKLNFGELFLIAETNGITPIQLAELYGARVSEAGRILNEHSQLQKQLFRAARTSPKAREAARAAVKSEDEFNAAMRQAAGMEIADVGVMLPNLMTRITNRYRAALVTQMATAVRNAVNQTGRIGLDIMDRSMQKVLMSVLTPDAPRAKDPILAFGEVTRLLINPRMTARQVENIAIAIPKGGIKQRLFTSYLSDVPSNIPRAPSRLGRATDASIRFTSSMNLIQEKVIRSAVFSTDLDRRLQGRGLSFRRVVEEKRFKDLTTSEIAASIDHALLITFAETPSIRSTSAFERMGARYVGFVNDIPGLAIVGETFPRFFFNAVKHITEFMPTGLIKATTKKERLRMANGDFETVSRASIGTGMIGLAYLIRTGQVEGVDPGDKFDEVTLSDGTNISGKAYSPFMLPHMFIVDTLLRISDDRFQPLSFREWREGFLGSSTRAENTLSAVDRTMDFFSGINDEESYFRMLGLMAGDITKGFLTPFRQINDFMQEFGTSWDERFSQIKSSRRDALAPIQSALPGGPQGDVFGLESTFDADITDPLPNFESPTREDDLRVPRVNLGTIPLFGFEIGTISGGLFKQVTGFVANSPKNIIEQEIDFLGFPRGKLTAKTGNKRVDQVVHRLMGPTLELIGAAVVSSPSYKSIEDNRVRIKIVDEVIKLARKNSLEAVSAAFPEFKLQKQLDRTPEIDRNMLDAALEDYGLNLADIESRVGEVVSQTLKDLGQ